MTDCAERGDGSACDEPGRLLLELTLRTLLAGFPSGSAKKITTRCGQHRRAKPDDSLVSVNPFVSVSKLL